MCAVIFMRLFSQRVGSSTRDGWRAGLYIYIYVCVCMLFSVFQAGCVSIQELNAISDKRVSACFCFVLFFYALYNVRDGGYVTCLSTKCRVWSARSIPHTAHAIFGRFR